MTKRELYTTITTELQSTLDSDTLIKVMTVLDKYIKPKKRQFAVDHIVKDSKGNITHIICDLSKKALPATSEYFSVLVRGGILVGDTRYSMRSKKAEKILKEFNITNAKKRKELVMELSNSGANISEIQNKIMELSKEQPDYSNLEEGDIY